MFCFVMPSQATLHGPKVSGRGAQSGLVPARFGLKQREADGDWLDAQDEIDGCASLTHDARPVVAEQLPAQDWIVAAA